MIPVKKLYGEIERAELCAVRIFDKFGNKIHEYEGSNSTDLVEHLKEIHSMYKYYGQCEMWCCTDKQATANFRSAFKWKVTFADKEDAAVTSGKQTETMADRMKETLEMMMMMKSVFGNNDDGKLQQQLLDAKLETFKAQNSIELKKLEMGNSDPMKQYGWAAPLVLSGLGKSAEEIKTLMGLSQLANVAGVNGEKVASVKNEKTTFEEMQKWSNEAKNERIQQLEEKLFNVVSAEHFIMLLELIIEKPARVQQAITAAQQGII